MSRADDLAKAIADTRRQANEVEARISRILTMPSGAARRRAMALAESERAEFAKEIARLRKMQKGAAPKPTQPDAPAPRAQSAGREKGEKWRPSSCDVTKLPPQRGGWKELSFSRHDVAAFEARDREAIEQARRRIAQSESQDLFCPVPEIVHELSPGSLAVYAYVTLDGKRTHVGTLAAQADTLDGERVFVTKSADIEEYGVLADCPGIGRKMYERAAEVACASGGRIVGSRLRSVFSEKFWKRQITRKRATCRGSTAEVFGAPLDRLREALEDGRITVPQFVQLTCNVGPRPSANLWPCEYVPLSRGACPTPPAKHVDLSGLKGRGRYRLTTASRRR